MTFTTQLYPSEVCTCCARLADALSRTYRRCRGCYATCPAIGSCSSRKDHR